MSFSIKTLTNVKANYVKARIIRLAKIKANKEKKTKQKEEDDQTYLQKILVNKLKEW
tara:strand:- start:36 stop:206 length:171 start_codon:yes stop_codon:yes gene_type:complete